MFSSPGLPAVIPAQFGLVCGAILFSYVVHHMYMPMGVMSARKKFGIKFPDLYANTENCADEKARNHFNCIQRGHQNCLENQPAFLAALIVAGLKHPVTASIFGGVYVLGRALYFSGYSTGKPNGRLGGSALGYVGMFSLLGICGKVAWAAVQTALDK